MNTTTIPRGLTPQEAASELQSGISTALTATDTVSATRLSDLTLVHKARLSQLTRSVKAATAQYGEASSQAAKAQAAVTAEHNIVARVELVKRRTALTAPTVSANGWAVWGLVHDTNSKPLRGYCVFLVDEQKNYQSEYGFAYTDESGAFTINFAGAATAAGQTKATVPTVFLSITNAKAQQVFIGSKALSLTIGSALYVDTALPVGAPPLGDIPQEIQRTAVPPPRSV